MDFSEKLLTLRKSKDLTQEQLAERLNVSRQSVSRWESGQTVPELEKIIALSEVFDGNIFGIFCCLFYRTFLFSNLESICHSFRIFYCNSNSNLCLGKLYEQAGINKIRLDK